MRRAPIDLFGNPDHAVPFREERAVIHFRKLIKQWRQHFGGDGWPTNAHDLHVLLQRAMIEEGAKREVIAFVLSGASPEAQQ